MNSKSLSFSGHTVDIYDSTASIADAVHANGAEKVRLFARESEAALPDVAVEPFLSAAAAGNSSADVCMLDGKAIKVLAVRYPSDARYVWARLAFRSGWLVGFPGLVRRLLLGRVRYGGVRVLKSDKHGSSYWLALYRTKKTVTQEQLFVPKSVGAESFFAWLRKENITYVVPRFYEQLPELHREDGDLDLLVENEDAPRVEAFLREHMEGYTGTNAELVRIGMHTVSRGSGVPYFPPPLATQMLVGAIDGPAGSRIPNQQDALHAFMYHALYHHKGYATNIPSSLGGKPEHVPDNDYGGIIQEKAKVLGVNVGTTMEDMDEYLATVGWQPKRDTLSKVAEKNAWVRDRFFTSSGENMSGLVVFILKQRALERELKEKIVALLRDSGVSIIRAHTFSEEERVRATRDVRGGNWVDNDGSLEPWLPAAIIIAVDPRSAHLPFAYAGEYERLRVTERKAKIREAFDIPGEASLVHSADNTQEALDYIEACFPNEFDSIQEEVRRASHASLFVRLSRYISPHFISHTLRCTLRDFVTKRLL